MALVSFEVFKSNPCSIKIKGSEFNLISLKKFHSIILQIEKENDVKKLSIFGNFNTKLLIKEIFKSTTDNLDNILILLQSITKTIEDSNIIFTSYIKGKTQGPALEIALSCNFIKAEKETTIYFDNIDKGYIPFFGTTQRLTRVLGYRSTLQVLLLDKMISYKNATYFKIINNKKDNTTKIKRKKIFWDNIFTNTFIFFNSKIHSTYKNKRPSYNAILSIIYEGSICQYDIALSVEKRWLKWLLQHRLTQL